jgi:hypothetical protein
MSIINKKGRCIMNKDLLLFAEKDDEDGKYIVKEEGFTYSTRPIEPGSPEYAAAGDYMNAHGFWPMESLDWSLPQIHECGQKLLNGKLTLRQKKRAILILAHHGTYEALAYLKKYKKVAPKELCGWLPLAIDECNMFLLNQLGAISNNN